MDTENRIVEITDQQMRDAATIATIRADIRELKDKFTHLFVVSTILLAGVLLSLIIGA